MIEAPVKQNNLSKICQGRMLGSLRWWTGKDCKQTYFRKITPLRYYNKNRLLHTMKFFITNKKRIKYVTTKKISF